MTAITASTRYTRRHQPSSPSSRSTSARRPAKTIPTPIPTPINPVANPRWLGASTLDATRGDGIQMAAPPRPITTSATAITAPWAAHDASSRPAVESTRPTAISRTSGRRAEIVATIAVPTR